MQSTKKIGRAVLGLVLATALIAGGRPANAWQYTMTGTCALESMFEVDHAWSLVVNSAGDIIAGGSIGVNPAFSDGVVTKLSGRLGAPSVLWDVRFTSDSAYAFNQVTQVMLDGAGNVVAGGYTGGSDGVTATEHLLVAKLDAGSGAILWQQEVFTTYGAVFTQQTGVAVDSAGNVLVAGMDDPEADGWVNWAVAKLDGGTGTVLWQATGPNLSYFNRVAVDHADNVLAVGEENPDPSQPEVTAVVKYDGATGTELWEIAGDKGQFNAIIVDASDNTFAAGGGMSGFRVQKLDTNGTALWNFAYPTLYQGAYGLILDGTGNVFATGNIPSPNPADGAGDMATFKLDGATGAVLWQSSLDGGALGWDNGKAIALDPSGNPVVGGFLTTAARTSMAIVKLDAMTGAEMWRAIVDGAGTDSVGSGQAANAVAIDPLGNVVAGGFLNPATGDYGDFAVVKRNGTDGTDFVQLCGNGVIEGTETCDDANTASGDGCSATCQSEVGFLCLGQPSNCVLTVGVAPKKLLVLDKLAASGSAKTVFAAKDPNVSKGTGTDPTTISTTFTAAYADGAARGGFTVPAGGGWLVNTAKVAKYVNKSAPAGPTETKVALIRPGSTLSLTAKGIGDTPLDILGAGDPAGAVDTAYCVTNGGPTICHCSVNQNCVFTKVAADTGAKLVCKGGVADPTCAALRP